MLGTAVDKGEGKCVCKDCIPKMKSEENNSTPLKTSNTKKIVLISVASSLVVAIALYSYFYFHRRNWPLGKSLYELGQKNIEFGEGLFALEGAIDQLNPGMIKHFKDELKNPNITESRKREIEEYLKDFKSLMKSNEVMFRKLKIEVDDFKGYMNTEGENIKRIRKLNKTDMSAKEKPNTIPEIKDVLRKAKGLRSRLNALLQESKHKAMFGSLTALRASMNIYKQENKGKHPKTLIDLSKSGALISIPNTYIPEHERSDEVELYDEIILKNGEIDGSKVRDTGKWGYIPELSIVFISCTHNDYTGKPLYSK